MTSPAASEAVSGLAERIREVLDAVAKEEPVSTETIAALLNEGSQQIAAEPEAGKALGPLLGRLRRARTAGPSVKVPWVPVGSGRLAIGHRPKLKSFPDLRSAGCTHVLTLLSEREGAPALGAAARHAGLAWHWLPLPNGDPPPPDRDEEIRSALTELNAELDDGASLFIHCSAGIHRTGMIANALIRLRGIPAVEARHLLAQLRAVTQEGVGRQRLDWAEQLVSAGGVPD